jgi:hypothetical protein
MAAFVSTPPPRPPHPAPNVRDDRETPLQRGRDGAGYAGDLRHRSTAGAAANWHDGQITCRASTQQFVKNAVTDRLREAIRKATGLDRFVVSLLAMTEQVASSPHERSDMRGYQGIVDYPGSRSALPGYGLTGSAKQSGKQRGWKRFVVSLLAMTP